MSKLLWRLILSYLLPGVDDAGDPPEETDEGDETETVEEPEAGDEPEEGEEPEVSDEGEEPAKPLSRAQRAIITARERAQTAERDLAAARAALEEARRQPAQPTRAEPTDLQRIIAQEDAALANPELDSWQRYAIMANRSARSADERAQHALRSAEDLADRTRFEQIRITKPKVFAAYEGRVEALLKEHRSQGRNPPRDGLLKLLLGEDALNGKIKAEEKTPTKPSGARRGLTPGARSDVSASSGRLSEAEKRTRRLEGKII